MAKTSKEALMAPLQRTRLHEEIVSRLKDKILRREIQPGAKLPPERDLALTLGVNRSTIREALNKLESMELIEIRHGDGVYVRDYLESGSLELAKQMLMKNGAPDAGFIRNLAHLRRIMVPEIASEAARNRTGKDLEDLRRIIYETPEMADAERDWRVHNILGRASGNILFVILLNSFTNLLQDYASLYFDDPKNARKSKRFHEQLYEAVEKKESVEARRLVEEIYAYAEKALFKAIGAGGI